jgi:hypothetical protein
MATLAARSAISRAASDIGGFESAKTVSRSNKHCLPIGFFQALKRDGFWSKRHCPWFCRLRMMFSKKPLHVFQIKRDGAIGCAS